MLSLLASQPAVYATVVATVVVSITFHEMAHGYVAGRLGDDTPYASGHMTWNPLVHMGPFSLAACFLAGIAWGQMPVDHTRLRGRYAESYVALAGPAVNLAFAVLAFVGLGLFLRSGVLGGDDPRGERVAMILGVIGSINGLLFVFNLVPVPPLDGSAVLANLNRGYARWAGDPSNNGVRMLLFIAAFFVARPLAEVVSTAGGAVAGVIAGA